uniref:Protein kinase C-like 3 n=3 Tax=Bactrocera dorsalis TaxID=27457 RepID=A0A034VP17_BACDO
MDLADQIDDYICSFEGIGDLTMDSLAMFIFIWAVLALFLVWLCKFLYNKYMVNNNNKTPTSQSNSRQSSVAPGAASAAKTEASKRLSEPREVMASKADFKDLAAKPGGAARGRAPGGGAGGAAAGAGARRRMVRQGSTGPESRKKRYVPPPSNVVGPETTSVTWTSQVFRWLYSDLVIVNELLTSWVIALNETLKKSMEEHGVAVEVVRVLPDSPPPSLNNIFCNCDETNPSNMLITFDCDAQPVLQVKTYRQKAGKVDTSHYKVTISRFRARMATAMNYNTLKGEMKVDGYPDIRVAMNSVGAIKPMDQDEQQLQGVISDIITATLRDTVYPVDFSVYATCPRAEIDPLDMPQNLEGSNLSGLQPMISGRRLLVKIVKGEGLAEAKDPYVVVEMDEPAQKNQTGARQGATPYWDEHFLFELSPQSAEILFEVYDRPANGVETAKFLGLGLVGIDELAVGPASTQVLTLQPRPYETNPVSGTITVDFVFIEGAEIPAGPKPYKLKEALKISTPVINEHMKNGAGLADAAVRALQDGALSTTGQPSKSTLIIHSVQRNQNNSNAFKVEVNKDGRIEVKESPQEEVDGAVTQILESPLNDNTSESLLTANTTADIEQIQQEISVATDITASPTDSCPPNDVSLDESGVASGNSSALVASSAEFGQPNAASSPQAHNGYSPYNGNSATNSSQNYGYQSNSLPRNGAATSTPLSSAELDERGRSLRAGSSRLDHSRQSSISESSAISGFSSASNKTYVHEASTLVLETIENGVKRHFIVPLAIAQRPRWRRKGTKLHIYNDHTFIAKHLSGGGLQCQVCMKSIPRRPGKQGYECRDCNLICHKQCHIRAPQACPNPTVLSMELTSFPVLTEQDIL